MLPPLIWPNNVVHLGERADDLTVGDWLTFTTGVAIGILTIVTAVLIAWRQRVIEIRDRAADRAEREQQQRDEREREARLDRREAWRAEYVEIRELLKLGESIAYRVRNHGPCTRDGLSRLQLNRFAMGAEQLSRRSVQGLREPLHDLVAAADQLVQTAVLGGAEATATTPSAGWGQSPACSRAYVRQAVLQDRIAEELAEAVSRAWQTLRVEWGG